MIELDDDEARTVALTLERLAHEIGGDEEAMHWFDELWKRRQVGQHER